MELQMRAERERRAAVTNAEAGKRAAILESEGLRESQIQKAQGEKEASILRAQGQGSTIFLPAEAAGVMGAIGSMRELLRGRPIDTATPAIPGVGKSGELK